MAPLKFVIKCGNFAVLVDLHVLPLGGQEDASWFTSDHVEEVTALVRDAVDQRVKQYTGCLHNRGQPKQKKDMAPASAFFAKGKNFNLVANFLKRHFNLRCVHGDLRVFPERYVVCVSCPEDASAHHGNPSLAATALMEQSRSQYFSRAGETQESLTSSATTKKTVLQKIAKQASVQRENHGSSTGEQQQQQSSDQKVCPQKHPRGKHRVARSQSTSKETVSSSSQEALPEAVHKVPDPNTLNDAVTQIGTTEMQGLTQEQQQQQTETNPPDKISSVVFCQHITSRKTTGKRRKASNDNPGEDPHPQRAKRTCPGRAPATAQSQSLSAQTSKHDLLLPPPPPPLPPVEAKAAESKAFPVSECKKTTLEVELLTLGKRAQRLPLTSNNTAQTNQNRLAASLRGLSVKPASSGSSISSRSTLGEEGSKNVPRTSRLQRLKS